MTGRRGLEDRAGYLRITSEGRVAERGGRLDRFFERPPELGDRVEGPWWAAVAEAEEVPTVELAPQRWADILVRPAPDGSRWLLLTEASAPMSKLQELLQQMLELTLASEGQQQLSRALHVLDAVVLKPTADFLFTPIGRPPPWFASVFEHTDAPIDLVAEWTFLESFRPDAEIIWRAETVGVVRSGIWIEFIEGATETPLEAIALKTRDEDRLLVLQRVVDRHADEQRTLQQARELSFQHSALRDEIEKKEVLLHCVVHDLASPLSTIIACLDTFQSVVEDRTDLRTLLDAGLRQAQRQESLITQVLDVFKADLESLQGFEAPGDCPDLRRAIIDQAAALAPLGRLHDVSIVPSTPDHAVPVSAISSRLDRVLTNLIENAIRHSPRGGRVDVQLTVHPTTARVEVRDQGPGVPEDRRANLFEKLQQGPGGRGKAGLGLYFCRMMVDRWGGDIGYLASETAAPMPGACFWFEVTRV